MISTNFFDNFLLLKLNIIQSCNGELFKGIFLNSICLYFLKLLLFHNNSFVFT